MHAPDVSFSLAMVLRFNYNIFALPTTAKNGVYATLVRDVRSAFEECPIVKINCTGMHASDYKKIGAKLKV